MAERRRNHARQVLDGDLATLRETLLEGLLSEHTRHHRPEVVDATRALTDQPPAGVVGALSAMLRRPDSTPDLAIIDVPTLVVVGEEDGPSPPAVARAMQGAGARGHARRARWRRAPLQSGGTRGLQRRPL